jgi:hypothetical protein
MNRILVLALSFLGLALLRPTNLPAQPDSTPPASKDGGKFVSDVTVPDGTAFKPGERFIKTWRVLNSGSTTWENYQLFFTNGDPLGAPTFVAVPATPPGQTVDISVPMIAPTEAGTYQGNWGLRAMDGTGFGQPVFVLILVQGRLAEAVQRRLGTRPVLYMDLDGDEPVISAVHPNGTLTKGVVRSADVGCLVCAGSSSAVWSPDGRQFAFLVLDHETRASILYLQGIGGKAEVVARIEGGASDPIWAPDGKRIALLGDGIHMVDLSSRSTATYSLREVPEVIRATGLMFRVNKFRWSPDGRRILLSWGAAVVLDTVTRRVEVITQHPVFAEWGPNGEGVYYVDLLYEDDQATVFKDWGGLYYQALNRPEPVRLVQGLALTESLSLTKGDVGGAALWPGFITLSPAGPTLAIMLRRSDTKGTDLYLYDLGNKARANLGRPSRRIHLQDRVMAMDWSPTGKGMVGVVAWKGLNIKVLDFETEAWTTLAAVSPNETVVSLYGFGFRMISWTQ